MDTLWYSSASFSRDYSTVLLHSAVCSCWHASCVLCACRFVLHNYYLHLSLVQSREGFYRQNALSIANPQVSKHWKKQM